MTLGKGKQKEIKEGESVARVETKRGHILESHFTIITVHYMALVMATLTGNDLLAQSPEHELAHIREKSWGPRHQTGRLNLTVTIAVTTTIDNYV